MQRETTEQLIHEIEGVIATIEQSRKTIGQTRREREAGELLKDARLKLAEQREALGKEGTS